MFWCVLQTINTVVINGRGDNVAYYYAAQHITIPVRFAFQWDDPIRNRDNGIAQFNTAEKSMHSNPGGHADIPETEIESWDGFFQKHLE